MSCCATGCYGLTVTSPSTHSPNPRCLKRPNHPNLFPSRFSEVNSVRSILANNKSFSTASTFLPQKVFLEDARPLPLEYPGSAAGDGLGRFWKPQPLNAFQRPWSGWGVLSRPKKEPLPIPGLTGATAPVLC